MNKNTEIIKNLTREDFENKKADLHIHTTYSDGKADFKDIVKQAAENGYGIISITDHNTVSGHIENPGTNVITGVEFDVWYKYIFLHLLAYGIDVNYEGMKKFYAKNKCGTKADVVRIFSMRNLKNLITEIHNAGGIAVLAHPACCWAFNMENFVKDLSEMGLDGLEVYYPYPRWRKFVKFSNPDNLEKLADKYGLIKTGGSDLHGKFLK